MKKQAQMHLISISLASAALLGGCAGARIGPRPERDAVSEGTRPLGNGAIAMPDVVDADKDVGMAPTARVLAWDRPSKSTVDAMLVANGGGVDSSFLAQSPARARGFLMADMPTERADQRAGSMTGMPTSVPSGDAEMAGMPAGRAASQAGSMTEIMGAPGLVPFDVMTGQAGKWMVGYQFMIEKMDGNRDGTDDLSETEVLARYFASPTDMTMQMHMGMVMYAPTDRLALMAIVPYIRKEMNHVTVGGGRFTERTDGLGDVELRGIYAVHQANDLRHRFLLNGGVGLPTGPIDAKMDGMRLEYPMQIGSGTYSLLPGFTYLGQALPWGWAADFHATVRVGRNDNGYRLGNRYQSSVSIARELPNGVSLSTGVRGEWWESIHGADPLLDPMDEPTKDPKLQGGRRLSAMFGVTFHPQGGPLDGQHFHLQYEVPLAESLDGPQLRRSWVVRLGWQLEF